MALSISIVGATGFVGRRVVRALAQSSGVGHLQLLSRTAPSASIFDAVPSSRYEWRRVDAMEMLEQPRKWAELFKGQDAVISCLGAFGTTNDFMFKINGSANEAIVRGAKDAGIPKLVYISAHAFGIPSIAPWFLPGYFNGKRHAEDAVAKAYGGAEAGSSAVILRPGFVHGRRQVTESITLPLDLVGEPMEKAMKSIASNLPTTLHPPVSVDQVGKAAAKAATESTGEGVSYWEWREIMRA